MPIPASGQVSFADIKNEFIGYGLGGSIQFNGSNQYLTFPSTGALSGTVFTVEAFINLTAYKTTACVFSTTGLAFNITGSGSAFTGIQLVTPVTGLINSTFSNTFNLNTWYHIVLTRNASGVFTIYVNGSSVGTVTNTSTWTDTSPYSIALYTAGTPNYFPGYITNFRIVGGVQVYTVNFTKPTNPLDSTTNTANQRILLNCLRSADYLTDTNGSLAYVAVTAVGPSPTPGPPTFSTSSPFTSTLTDISLGDYRGIGKYVNTDISVPATGAISISNFYSKTNATTKVTTQTGISASNGTNTGLIAPGNDNGYGPYAIYSMANHSFTAPFNVVAIQIFLDNSSIDFGFRIYAARNGVWEYSTREALYGVYDGAGGQNRQTGTSRIIPWYAAAGTAIQIGYATGTAWQQIINNGTCTVTLYKG